MTTVSICERRHKVAGIWGNERHIQLVPVSDFPVIRIVPTLLVDATASQVSTCPQSYPQATTVDYPATLKIN